MIFFKTAGLCLVFGVCVLGGFYLSARLSQRRRTLHEICIATGEIANRIQMCEERGQILKKVFENKNLQVCEDKNYNITISSGILRKEDISLLNEFFSRLGASDTVSQLSLCDTYKKLFEKAYDSAKAEETTKGQMYKTCGVLTAAALIIFII